jgi:PAS domain S-box-containing protein
MHQPGLSEALVEQIADALIFADREGRIQVWNAAAEAVFGYPAEEVLGRGLDVLIPERLRAAHWDGFDAAVQAGRLKHGREPTTTRSRHRDGRDLYVDLSFALLKDGDGHVLGSVAVARDVTERFQAQKASRRRIAELEALVNAER